KMSSGHNSRPSLLSTDLTTLFDIRYPIISAPMSGAAGANLAIAVSQAGGLGLIAGGAGNAFSWLKQQIIQCNNTKYSNGTKLKYGVGLITLGLPYFPQAFEYVLAAKPTAILFSFGDAKAYAQRVKQAGIEVISQIQNVQDGISAAEYSDVIVCQGEEAGGHGQSGLSTWTLLPLLQKKLRELGKTVPLVAAGGIGDENGLITALDMV
ncbi:unnamed protein product, partial [Didymodactylos carnosus]